MKKIVPSYGCSVTELVKIFGDVSVSRILATFTASEALEKIREYEEKQKVEEEIKVGDEIYYGNNTSKLIVIVVGLNQDKVKVLDDSMTTYIVNKKSCVKTGRHFPQIIEVLEQMKESEVKDNRPS